MLNLPGDLPGGETANMANTPAQTSPSLPNVTAGKPRMNRTVLVGIGVIVVIVVIAVILLIKL